MLDRAYISGPLMAAKDLESMKTLYSFIAKICCENGLNAYLPHNNTDPTKDINISDDEVFHKDYFEMVNSSLVISYIGEPSLGVGAELSICVSKNIPIVTINETNQKVSRFLKGMLKSSDNVYSMEYDSKEELQQKLGNYLQFFSSLQRNIGISERSSG